MISAQEWLETQEEYNTKEKREQITELNISGLCGELNLSEFINLEKLNLWGNLLTKITFPANPINLKELYLGGCNRLTGSLDFLSSMKNLKVLEIIDNDFDEVDLDKLPRSLEDISYSALRPDCKLAKIIPELDKVKYGFCQTCLKPNTSRKWCQSCAEEEWKQDIQSLPEQEIVEKLIQNLGKDAYSRDRLQWIPYKWFEVEKDKNGKDKVLGEGGYGKVYKAKWKIRLSYHNPYNDIALKSLHKYKNITIEFLTELTNNILVNDYNTSPHTVKCWGVSQDSSKNYVMVMDHIKGGNLREYLKQNYQQINLKEKISKLYNIAMGLASIHEQNLVHLDLHPGNILNDKYGDGDGDGFDRSFVTDVGQSRLVGYQKESKNFGITEYMAPEVLLKNPHILAASDIYSFGIIAYELLTNAYPYYEHKGLGNNKLAAKIIEDELRPDIDKIPLPQLLKELIKSCWVGIPKNRPNARKLYETLGAWYIEVYNKKNSPFYQQYKEIEEEYNYFSKNTPYRIHPTSIVTSKLIDTRQITKLLKKTRN